LRDRDNVFSKGVSDARLVHDVRVLAREVHYDDLIPKNEAKEPRNIYLPVSGLKR